MSSSCAGIKIRLQALRWFFCCQFDVFTLSLRKKNNIMEDDNQQKLDTLDFGPVEDTTKEIIKVVGVGGGGCNAVNLLSRSRHIGIDSAVDKPERNIQGRHLGKPALGLESQRCMLPA